ncbi:MAG: hypothetical protein RL318_723 [Fibrobacterota bacterium]|jgi:hypothetical protein
MTDSRDDQELNLRRWRLILGRHADRPLNEPNLTRKERGVDQALSYLFDREHAGRGILGARSGHGGGLNASNLTAMDWLGKIHDLFPRDVCERLESKAIEEYGLVDLLKSPEILDRIEPNEALARSLLGMRGRLGPEAQNGIRRIIRTVVEDLQKRLKPVFQNAVHGRRNRFRRSNLPVSQNFDAAGTIRANLKHFDLASGKLPIRQPLFHARQQRKLPWTIVLCVDQSASMAGSVLYSAVVAGILHAIESVQIHLVVFDTQVLDLTPLCHDPVEVLMGIQLGGGTNIGKAMHYCESLITVPTRSIVILLSDFEEGASPASLLGCVARLNQSRVKLLGLASLTDGGDPWYDRAMGQRLGSLGMQVAALSPGRLAQWLGEAMA